MYIWKIRNGFGNVLLNVLGDILQKRNHLMTIDTTHHVQRELLKMTTDDLDKLRYKIHYLFSNRLARIPNGPSADDLLQDVFEKLMDGRRKWPEKRVSIVTCIINIIKSDISHLERNINKISKLELTNGLSSDIYDNKINGTTQYNIKNAGIDSVTRHLIHKETQNKILSLVSDDEILLNIMKLKFESPGISLKPRIIAETLDISVDVVNNAKKKLKKKLQKILQQEGENNA